MSYIDTDFYYLKTKEGLYAGHNKGVALFTDDYNGAIKFSQDYVDGNIITGRSNLIVISQIRELYPEASFVNCDTVTH